MRIKSISFRNVGPFGAKGIRLEGFTPELNVVCETNEFGKSTILKVLKFLLFKPYSAMSKDIKDVRTADSIEGVEGEIAFSSEGRDYIFFKRFLKQKGARLKDARSGEVLAVDRSAEEALAKILRADRFQGGPSGLLWVQQGTSMDGVSDDGQIASRLEGELGTLIGGERARDYLLRVETELGEILTRTGQEKKTGPLRATRDAVEKTSEKLIEANRQRDLTVSIGAELTKVRSEIERLEREAETSNVAQQIADTRISMEAARSFADQMDLLTAKSEQAAFSAERADRRQAKHIAALVNFNETRAKMTRLAAAHAEKKQVLQRAETKRSGLKQSILEIETRFDELSKTQAKQQRFHQQKQRFETLQKDLQHQSARLEQVDFLEIEISKLTDEMSDLPIIQREDVENLRHQTTMLRQFESELEAFSTRLYLDLVPSGKGKVKLDGASLTSGPIMLPGGSSLQIEGIGKLRSDANHLRDIEQKRNHAQTEYQALLSRLAISDISSASKIADRRQAIELERKRITLDMTRLAPEGRTAIETSLAAMDSDARDLAETLAEQGAEIEIDLNPDLRENLRRERAVFDVAEEALTQARAALAETETEQVRLKERLSGLDLSDNEALRERRATALAGDVLKAKADAQAAAAAVETLKSTAPDQPLDILSVRLKRLEQVSTQTRERLEVLKTKAAELRARRDAGFEGEDADGIVVALESRLEKNKEELTRQVRAKNVRILLRDTLVATQTRLRDAYTAPVTQELAPLLSRVIPGAQADLSDSLGVDTVQRNGKVEAIGQLSGGTREQFAILTRLAYARLLARGGARAPVILDDALVYADDARRDAMFDVLGLVSSGESPIQIIYLSCHAGATAQLGGTRIAPQPWLV